ncbi:MAG: CaiB/BaiF CoA transferase family protein [Acidimicrobiia bacterium]
MRPPLEGYTVVTMEHAVACPYATRQLADLGARVIKIERPDGGDFARAYDTHVNGLATYFVWLNRGKESVALDVKQPAALAALHRLIDHADVFVQNLAPGAAARLGLSATELRSRNPRLIVCDIDGYGPDGPYSDKRAYDMLIQCEAGLASVTGTADAPAKAGVAVADLTAGTFAFNGILTALLARERTGEGASLSVAMLDTVAEWMTFSALYSRYSGQPQVAAGLRHPSLVPYDAYPCRGGARIVIGIQNDREWQRLCAALGMAEAAADARFATNEGRAAHRTDVDAVLDAALADQDVDDVAIRLEAAGIANARLRNSLELLDHPQLAARNRWRDTPTPVGPVPVLAPPVTFDGYDPDFKPIPELGEHTTAVLAEFGIEL